MARNSPAGQPGVRAPTRRHPTDDPFTAPPTGQPAAHWPPAPQYAEQQQPAAHPAHWPPAGHFEGHHFDQAATQPAGQWPPAPQYADQQPQHAQPQSQGYYYPQGAEPEPNYGFGQPAPGYPPQHQQTQAHRQAGHQQPVGHAPQAPPPWSQQQQPDPRNFDLGNYMPAPGQQQGYAQPEAAQFQQHLHDPAHFGAPQQGYAETEAEYDETMGEDEEEPRRGRRGLMIAAALVGAIGLGGGMAYTYKSLFASSGARAPLIKNVDSGPNKIRPEVPGGKQFAHTDKKLLNRLPDDKAPGASESDSPDERVSDDPNAPRKVKIIPITPSGAPPGAVVTSSVPPPSRSGPPMVAVPGVTLENMQPAPSAARAQMPPPQAPMARVAPPQQPAAPVRVASAAPTQVPAAAEPPPPPARKIVTHKDPVPKVKEARALVAPAATSTSGTSGYVAVLSSKKSRMDALKAFADLQQKYGDVLATRTPDVQEANLGDKGVWYRAVVGPPGSRDAAAGVCGQLKTAGYTGCWVTAY